MIKCKNSYLSIPVVSNFVDYFADLIKGKEFNHEFKIRGKNLLPPDYDYCEGDILKIDKLENAYKKYWWNKKDYAENKEILDIISEDIGEYRKGEESREECLKVLSDVLEWGAGNKNKKGLYGSNMNWAKGKDKIHKLMEEGVKEMQKDNPNPKVFKNKEGPRMNAGFTKYYALACQNVIIYDGRVAAALGLLTIKFLIEKGEEKVPPELDFGWTRPNSKNIRNPNKSKENPNQQYKFQEIGYDKHHIHAESNIRANWIISQAMCKTKDKEWDSEKIEMRKIEAALFILGYSL